MGKNINQKSKNIQYFRSLISFLTEKVLFFPFIYLLYLKLTIIIELFLVIFALLFVNYARLC